MRVVAPGVDCDALELELELERTTMFGMPNRVRVTMAKPC